MTEKLHPQHDDVETPERPRGLIDDEAAYNRVKDLFHKLLSFGQSPQEVPFATLVEELGQALGLHDDPDLTKVYLVAEQFLAAYPRKLEIEKKSLRVGQRVTVSGGVRGTIKAITKKYLLDIEYDEADRQYAPRESIDPQYVMRLSND